MTVSISLTLDSFVSGLYTYALTDTQYIGVYRTEEMFAVASGGVQTDTSAYIIYLSSTDGSGTETRTLQSDIIGVAGSACTLTPVSDSALNGVQLTDSNLEDVTLEVTYGD